MLACESQDVRRPWLATSSDVPPARSFLTPFDSIASQPLHLKTDPAGSHRRYLIGGGSVEPRRTQRHVSGTGGLLKAQMFALWRGSPSGPVLRPLRESQHSMRDTRLVIDHTLSMTKSCRPFCVDLVTYGTDRPVHGGAEITRTSKGPRPALAWFGRTWA